jgi:hypothetical protein
VIPGDDENAWILRLFRTSVHLTTGWNSQPYPLFSWISSYLVLTSFELLAGFLVATFFVNVVFEMNVLPP